MSINNILNNIPEISFIDELTVEKMQNEMITNFQEKYKEITGKEISLAKADPYRLILYACSLQQYQAMQYIDIQGKMNLLKYSKGAFLDQIAALKGIERNQGTKAITRMKFYLEEVRLSNTSIPKGTRITVDNLYFLTKEFVEIEAGNKTVEVDAECGSIGIEGNGYLPGEIIKIVDSIPYIEKAVNIIPSNYGTDIESDEAFTERIYLSPSKYSVAGPEDAYVYFAKEYSSIIADVKVSSPSPTVVDVRFILNKGNLPEESMINGLQEYLNAKERRPLTDRVEVAAPIIEKYNLKVKYYINESNKSIATSIQEKVNEAIETYIEWQDTKIGRDINPSFLIHQMMIAGAKRVEVMEPVFTEISDIKIPQVNNRSIIYGGIEHD